jgi:hypothetical protein
LWVVPRDLVGARDTAALRSLVADAVALAESLRPAVHA